MLGKLFARLTAQPEEGSALFDWVTAEARRPEWYVDGAVPDTIDGRFAMVSTIAALAIVRLEGMGGEGEAQSVLLTERFTQVMESEHRELGLGDPTLGKTVLKLVSSLARRVGIARRASTGEIDWETVSAESFRDGDDQATVWRAKALALVNERLNAASLAQLVEGTIA